MSDLRSVLSMILNALDRDAEDGKAARGEMAEELRAVLAQEAGPVVEPVAWQLDVEGYTTVTYDNYQKVLAEQEHFRGRGRTAVIRNLFTSPPAPVAPEEPIAYMRNEGKPNNLVKCTFACPGAFGIYASKGF